jgi:hypothetical protein
MIQPLFFGANAPRFRFSDLVCERCHNSAPGLSRFPSPKSSLKQITCLTFNESEICNSISNQDLELLRSSSILEYLSYSLNFRRFQAEIILIRPNQYLGNTFSYS